VYSKPYTKSSDPKLNVLKIYRQTDPRPSGR
jgi:hypothetical protein